MRKIYCMKNKKGRKKERKEERIGLNSKLPKTLHKYL